MTATLDKPAIVYQAVNLINGKRYIGITMRSLRQRVYEHRYDAMSGRRRCIRFHHAIRRYGMDGFEFSVVSTVSSFAEACAIEQRLIAEQSPEYNISTGGDGNPGRVVSDAAKAKISAANSGRAAHNKGSKHTEEARAKMSVSARRRPHFPPEHMKKMWAAGAVYLAEKVMRPVICLTNGRKFKSATDAALAFGWKPYVVSNAISKQRGVTRGYRFAHEERV